MIQKEQSKASEMYVGLNGALVSLATPKTPGAASDNLTQRVKEADGYVPKKGGELGRYGTHNGYEQGYRPQRCRY
jgi:hypothetical protein